MMKLLALVATLAVTTWGQDVEMETVNDVEINARPQYLYSSISPKLRINGKGFGKNPAEVHLVFDPPLTKKGKTIYNMSTTDTVVSIGLQKGMKWPTFAETSQLFLTSIIVDKWGDSNQLESKVAVATVIAPPSVVRGEDKLIYMTGTPRFLINGTGFREGTMSLTFDPPLIRDVDYVLAVRSPTVMQLVLKTGRKWRSDGEPGPLRLRRIDSGAGALRIDPKFGGVIVAEVQVDLGGHGVTAVANSQLLVYQNTPTITVKGAGFDHANTQEGFGAPKMRWGNGLLGRGVNYSVSTFDDSRMEMVLKPGSFWRANGANLPAPLTLLAADVGSGFVAVGATEARKGVRVATVFENPLVTPQPLTSLFRTHSAQLWITGVGFSRAGAAQGLGSEMKLEFVPELKVGVDYTLTVFNRTHALVRLREGRAWAAEPGPLYVTACDAGAGAYPNFKPAAVAHVVPDAGPHESGVDVTRTNHQVLYQTPAIRHLEIHGASLSNKAKLVFTPELKRDVDYKVHRATSDTMILSLLAGKQWRQTAGPLVLKSIDTGKDGALVEMAHGTGIVVADIAANPTVATSTARITASTTRRLSIYGTGFSIDGTELTLEPTSRSAYDVEAVYENEVVLRLKDGKQWGVAPKEPKTTLQLVVTKIDTAAGEYIFQDADGKPIPVTVATIVHDTAATGLNGDVLRCDDTCMWANDGVCDDGSQDNNGESEDNNGGAWWEDDDLGGWYSDERDDAIEQDGDGDGDAYDYGYMYDDSYGYYGDDAAMPACVLGTDCTDCGGPLAYTNEGADGQFGDSASSSSALDLAGDWDDDEWFDDDTGDWWDDDYDFGEEWDGFEDDEKDGDVPMGIITSVQPASKPNKRHSRDKNDPNAAGAEFEIADYPKVLAAAVVAALLAAYCALSPLFKAKKTGTLSKDEEDGACCAGLTGKQKKAQA